MLFFFTTFLGAGLTPSGMMLVRDLRFVLRGEA
jgi:hypothetical protein